MQHTLANVTICVDSDSFYKRYENVKENLQRKKKKRLIIVRATVNTQRIQNKTST